jgi:hypothetical protein
MHAWVTACFHSEVTRGYSFTWCGKCIAGRPSALCILLQTLQHLLHGVLVVLCASMLGEFQHVYHEHSHLRDCSGRVCQGVVSCFFHRSDNGHVRICSWVAYLSFDNLCYRSCGLMSLPPQTFVIVKCNHCTETQPDYLFGVSAASLAGGQGPALPQPWRPSSSRRQHRRGYAPQQHGWRPTHWPGGRQSCHRHQQLRTMCLQLHLAERARAPRALNQPEHPAARAKRFSL